MRTFGDGCFICGCSDYTCPDRHYRRCAGCGHEVIRTSGEAAPIINDVLSDREIASFGFLDRFKRRVVLSCKEKSDTLLDIGTASGKFLYHNKRFFRSAIGIEVTRECIDFARNHLGLVVHDDISKVQEPISLATLWHSLEHIPVAEIKRMFRELGRLAAPDIRIIVSVPNGGSLQRQVLGQYYAYYDPTSHMHQFTSRSIDKLMDTYGFVRERSFFSLAYASFGSLQGLMNLCMGIHNYLYYRKKRNWTYNLAPGVLAVLDAYNYALAALVLFPAAVMTLVESFLENKGAVLTLCYRKR